MVSRQKGTAQMRGNESLSNGYGWNRVELIEKGLDWMNDWLQENREE